VVTNAHVVDGAKRVRVRLADDREFEALVKGRDLRMDLALLQIQGANGDLPAVSLGSSDALKVGEYVVAVGNPFGLGHTVTMGIVSAKGREIGAGPYDDFIQTDASINPGNSGGPLFDTRGEVIGINTAINPEAEGIGFAIPVDALKDVLPQLVAKGRVDRGRLGVMVQGVDMALAKAMGLDGPKGALVEDVEEGGPAASAGLKPGDLIVAVGDHAIARSEELPRTIAKHEPGEKVSLKILRDKQEHVVDVMLDAIKEKVDHSIDDDAADEHPSGKMGVAVADAPEGGALVRAVEPLSPADGELLPGDVVLTVDGKKIGNAKALAKTIAAAPKGKALLLEVIRDGKKRWVGVELKG
jgi:serine protease Do